MWNDTTAWRNLCGPDPHKTVGCAAGTVAKGRSEPAWATCCFDPATDCEAELTTSCSADTTGDMSLKCGDACATPCTGSFCVAVVSYCQADGTCGMSSEPTCSAPATMPTPGSKCNGKTPDYVERGEYCGAEVETTRCSCDTAMTWQCMVARRARGMIPCCMGVECGEGAECDDNTGGCVAAPCTCTKIYMPVCGSDGITQYDNSCVAECDGLAPKEYMAGECCSTFKSCETCTSSGNTNKACRWLGNGECLAGCLIADLSCYDGTAQNKCPVAKEVCAAKTSCSSCTDVGCKWQTEYEKETQVCAPECGVGGMMYIPEEDRTKYTCYEKNGGRECPAEPPFSCSCGDPCSHNGVTGTCQADGTTCANNIVPPTCATPSCAAAKTGDNSLKCGDDCTPECPKGVACPEAVQYCQADGTCGMSSEPKCEKSCKGEGGRLACGDTCTKPCPLNEFCTTVEKFCQADGTCDVNSEPSCAVDECVCQEIYLPVCGSDGTTYSNKCKAGCANVRFDDGACSRDDCADSMCDACPADMVSDPDGGCCACKVNGKVISTSVDAASNTCSGGACQVRRGLRYVARQRP